MTEKSYLLVENGVVVNAVLWDGESEWAPATGQQAVDPGESEAWIGWTHQNGAFSAPTEQSDQT